MVKHFSHIKKKFKQEQQDIQ